MNTNRHYTCYVCTQHASALSIWFTIIILHWQCCKTKPKNNRGLEVYRLSVFCTVMGMYVICLYVIGGHIMTCMSSISSCMKFNYFMAPAWPCYILACSACTAQCMEFCPWIVYSIELQIKVILYFVDIVHSHSLWMHDQAWINFCVYTWDAP